jgi:lipopolysaccharide export system protein LptA
VWTPRRVLLLILGMVLFSAAFGVYSRFLGWIDGLPEIPPDLLARRAADEIPAGQSLGPVEAKLQQAFGPDCVEATDKYNIKLELHSRGIVFAAGEFGIDAEGCVRFWPFSLATFKERAGEYPEINTVHSDAARLEFDRPVRSVAEISTRKIVGCTLESDSSVMSSDPRKGIIHITNNRGTPSPDDDLVLETPGPFYYHEVEQPNLPLDKAVPQMKTAAVVKMVDHKRQPDSTTITAQGMEVYLTGESPNPTPAGSAKPRGSGVSGLRRLVLPSNVDMNLWMDPKEGFLAAGAKPQPAKPVATPAPGVAADKPAAPTHVLITTLGKFTYDVHPDGDLARFDRLPAGSTQLPDCVRVVRPLVGGPESQFNDQLECDVLEMHFAAKTPPATAGPLPAVPAKSPAPSAANDNQNSIDWIHAWGQFIVLTSDAEKLDARGNDLFYDAKTKGTTLKGIPEMVAVKDGHEIHAPQLVMYGADAKDGRHAEAPGPGHFRLVDRTGTKRTVEARWRDHMNYQQDDGFDLLTLNGEASFEDKENGQLLRADQLKLRLAPEPKTPTTDAAKTPASDPTKVVATDPVKAPKTEETKAPGATAANPPKPHPQRLEAMGHVAARSPELTIHDTEQLVLLFKDLPPLPPGTTPAAPAANSPWSTPVAATPTSTAAQTNPAQPAAQPAAPGQPQAVPPPKKPVDVAARTVQAFINRQGEVNLLDTVHCEGDVRVHQDPMPPQEKPIDMRGRALKLKHTVDGDVLTVTGTVAVPGEVHTPDLSMLGPFIVIDQVENVAEVQGLGSMRMISKSDLDGKKLDDPTPITITWKQGMKFTGQHARFHGNVQADQDNTTLLCQTMQVYLNRPVSLRQQRVGEQRIGEQKVAEPRAGEQRVGEPQTPDKEPATIDKVVCEGGDQPQGVNIFETVRDDDDKLVKSTRIEADEVAILKPEGLMDAVNHRNSRGNVRIVQLGPKGEPGGGPPQPNKRPPAKAPPPKPVEQEWKLTWVRYNGTMKANNQTRTARFFDGVEVLYLPVESPDRLPPFDATVNRLPTGAMHLTSSQLIVYNAKDSAGQTRQQMEAAGRAKVTWGDEFFGTADVIRFDESKQQMTLEGQNGGYAVANRLRVKPGEPKRVIARKIIYIRSTDEIISDGVLSITP